MCSAAWAWAFIPAAAGAGLVLFGLRSGNRPLAFVGLRVIAIAGALLLAGAWYFDILFRTGEPPFIVGDAWPLILISVGSLVTLAGLLRRDPRATPPPG